MKIVMLSVSALALALVSAGCATTHARETQLDMKAKTAALEPQDVRRTVEKMVDSMLADQEFISEIGGKKPVIDMGSITSSIRTKLIRSRKFRFMDHSTSSDDLQFMNDQALNGLTDQSKAIRAGQQSAAQMFLYGELSEMRSQIDGITDRYFKFTLNLKDLKSGELIWSDEQEIRKEMKTSVMGF